MSDAPFIQALVNLQMTPQEQYLYFHHMNNLYGPGKVQNDDGTISTMQQAVMQGPGGLHYSIPTVWDGKVLSPPEAMTRAIQAGIQNFPAYTSPEQADMRYEDIHKYIADDTARYQSTRSNQ